MPWKIGDVDEKIKGLTPKEKANWVKIANSARKSCIAKGGSEKACDASAIKIANSKAKGTHSEIEEIINDFSVINFSSSIKTKDVNKLETEQTDEGLLIKGIPVFKAGTYKDTEYSTDYIDRNFIGQFNAEDDIPIQADHNPSTFATLGYVKGLFRKAKMMYADFLLIDDNAIARWKKRLMKKFSLGVDLINDKIREISIVAFPYVKAARVHSEEEITEDTNIDATEVNGTYFVTIEGEQYKIGKDKDNLWFFFPISRRNADGEIEQSEEINITDEEIDNIDINEDVIDDEDIDKNSEFAKWTTKYKNSLPDSSFLLVRRPVRDKGGDRALPIRDANGKISRSHVQNALARINQVKSFSSENITTAKARLLRIAKKLGMKTESKHSEDLEMKLAELKKLDLSKLEGQGAEVLKEAVEHITTLETERDEAKQKLSDVEKKNKEYAEKIKESKVSAKVAELKDKGKITPAQEEATKKFMLTLDDKKIDDFVKVLSDGKSAVDLTEAGKETSEEKGAKDKLDIDKLEAPEINKVAEKLAEEHKVDFSEALDWCYDGKVSKDGKLLEK